MKNRILKILLLNIFFTSLLSCNYNKETKSLDIANDFDFIEKENIKNNTDKYGNFNGLIPIKIGNNTIKSRWITYKSTDGQLEFSIPDIWKIEKKKNFVVFCRIKELKNNYFSFISHNKDSNNIDLEKYIEYVMDVVKQDSFEVLVEVNKEIISNNDRKIVLFRFETKINKTSYYSYCCYTEDKDNIFDFTMKREKDKFNLIDEIYYKLVINNIVINGNKLINEPVKFPKIEEVKIGFKSKSES